MVSPRKLHKQRSMLVRVWRMRRSSRGKQLDQRLRVLEAAKKRQLRWQEQRLGQLWQQPSQHHEAQDEHGSRFKLTLMPWLEQLPMPLLMQEQVVMTWLRLQARQLELPWWQPGAVMRRQHVLQEKQRKLMGARSIHRPQQLGQQWHKQEARLEQ